MLDEAGYDILTALSGEEAMRVLAEVLPELVILDLGLPGMDGFAVTRRIREFADIPIIVVSAMEDEADKVRALDAGADDYMTKPFSQRELAARVRAALRRAAIRESSDGPAGRPYVRTGDLEVDFARNRVALAGQDLRLSATEHRLLAYLARNAGRVLTPDQILEHVWGEQYAGDAHLLRVAIARLRQKLGEAPGQPRYILTRRGIGYYLAPLS